MVSNITKKKMRVTVLSTQSQCLDEEKGGEKVILLFEFLLSRKLVLL